MSDDRFSQVGTFIAEWFGPIEPGDGYTLTEIEECEFLLGVRVPDAVRQWYIMAGRRNDINRPLHWIITPEDWHFVGSTLMLFSENQTCCHWGVALDDFENPDCPVTVGDFGLVPYRRIAHRFEDFIHNLAAMHYMNDANFRAWGYVTPEQAARFRERTERVSLPALCDISEPYLDEEMNEERYYPHRALHNEDYFRHDDSLITVGPDNGIFGSPEWELIHIGAKIRETAERLIEEIPVRGHRNEETPAQIQTKRRIYYGPVIYPET